VSGIGGGKDHFTDPRAFRWVESGVSGLARPREWDATAVVPAPELADSLPSELEFRAFPGTVVGGGDVAAVERLARELDSLLDRPYTALAVRRTATDWAVAARTLNAELVVIDVPSTIVFLEVAVAPDGETSYVVDDEVLAGSVDAPLERALAELERRGRARFQAFVARADRVDKERWQLTIDPL
jgi:hypothetical protein